jgi:hypothetical protein
MSLTRLQLFLRIFALGPMSAIFAAMLPMRVMDQIHRLIGLGPMPQGPIVEYLARSTSMFYALHGVLLWFIASDLRRYRELFRFYLWISLVFAAGLFLTDLSAGLPPRWTLVEGPIVATFIGIILVWFSNVDMDGHSAHTVRHERR